MTIAGGPRTGGTGGAAWADRYAAEDALLVAARTRATALGGPPPVEPAVGATLAVLAAGAGARAVVSIGSGGGVHGLWLLRGMRPDGVLTVLDTDAAQLRAARQALADAGVAPGRTRLIFGTPAEVLPRLSPGAYDLVACAGRPGEYAAHLASLVGLVRAGGTLTCHGLLAGDRIGDRAARDPETVTWRDLARAVREDEDLTSAVLPIGTGLLVATRRS
ncbi:O-methyltransferase [Geodermatophilus maliterrae]|uniref:O-methyltransferase n=1 Tax=Geodermatophilus maliterrae TaxID=3162531 RepID=A0ABV3XLR5_9ACTN